MKDRQVTVTGVDVQADGLASETHTFPVETPADTFRAWWDATIPNTEISRDTQRYNHLFSLRQQFLAVLDG